jgi:hypothetical protein
MKKLFNNLRFGLIASIILSLIGFITLVPNSYALAMNHQNMSTQACSLSCGNTRTASLAQAITFNQNDEDDIPVPPITEPYFVQFLKHNFAQNPSPKNLITASSYRPPDIMRLYASFKF